MVWGGLPRAELMTRDVMQKGHDVILCQRWAAELSGVHEPIDVPPGRRRL
jgi:hypothetical protein